MVVMRGRRVRSRGVILVYHGCCRSKKQNGERQEVSI